ncbi:hypothetical protein DFH09DRAFT_1077674 [Mycena vulgaris]|nr:hypothetical protein DFH09DRAFT_1077674 [Mycena vulgaris]
MCLDTLNPASTPHWVQWQPVGKVEPEPAIFQSHATAHPTHLWMAEGSHSRRGRRDVPPPHLCNLQSLRMSQNNHGYLYALVAYPKSLSKLTELSRPNLTTFKIFYYADPDNQKPSESEAATLESMHQEFDLEFKHWRWTEDSGAYSTTLEASERGHREH